ncbi:MAG TPA: hypothetical protein VMS56_14715 [Thermoanaerobaculia bacterium]|nr:hypothetical protein [Thermoanaerobaculia bacterium]
MKAAGVRLPVVSRCCGGGGEEGLQAESAEAAREREEREQGRAKELETDLASMAAMPIAELQATLKSAREQVKDTSAYAEVRGDLDEIDAGLASLQAVRTAASEGRAADVVEPALAGFLGVEGVISGRSARIDAALDDFVKLIERDGPTSELEKINRQMDVDRALIGLTKAPYDMSSLVLEIVAKNGTPEMRRAAFDSIAASIGQANVGRARLEHAMRTSYEEEEDEATRKGFAATMARLEVPLEAPEPAQTSTAKAAAAKGQPSN